MELKISPFLLKTINVSKIMKKQEIWRQKQIDVYYREGRPIFHNKNYNNSRFIFIK